MVRRYSFDREHSQFYCSIDRTSTCKRYSNIGNAWWRRFCNDLDIDPNQVTDVALNPNVAGASVVIHEDPDTIIPFFISGEINLSTGVLKVVFSETIDLTPISLVNTSKFSISNVVDGEFVNLFGAIASGFDLPTVTITLTEAQRVKAIEMSGQPGGDGNAQFLSANLGAVQDVSRNQLGANNNVTLSEVPDTVFPKLVAATINLGTKTVFITLSETIDSTPKSLVSLSRVSILNASGPKWEHAEWWHCSGDRWYKHYSCYIRGTTRRRFVQIENTRWGLQDTF